MNENETKKISYSRRRTKPLDCFKDSSSSTQDRQCLHLSGFFKISLAAMKAELVAHWATNELNAVKGNWP